MYLGRRGSGCERHLRTQLGWDFAEGGKAACVRSFDSTAFPPAHGISVFSFLRGAND